MAEEKHPYMGSKGPIFQLISHLRKSFPSTLDAVILKKLAIGPNNEGVLLNVLRFIGVIDEKGQKTKAATSVFTLHDDSSFQAALSDLVKDGYSELFALHGDTAWELDGDSLITFFRQHDQTSAITGKRQAVTFAALSSLCGRQEMPTVKGNVKYSPQKGKKAAKKNIQIKQGSKPTPKPQINTNNNTSLNGSVGLTVRIEVNLPADGDQETYDRIFKSIRENLLNG